MPLQTIKCYHQNSSPLLFATVRYKTQNLLQNLENIQKNSSLNRVAIKSTKTSTTGSTISPFWMCFRCSYIKYKFQHFHTFVFAELSLFLSQFYGETFKQQLRFAIPNVIRGITKKKKQKANKPKSKITKQLFST